MRRVVPALIGLLFLAATPAGAQSAAAPEEAGQAGLPAGGPAGAPAAGDNEKLHENGAGADDAGDENAGTNAPGGEDADATDAMVINPDPAAVRRSRFAERPSDAAYGAFQRGFYLSALNLATPLALEGDAAAQTLIGEIYSRGLGVRRDLAMAIEWYGKAAEQKMPEAMFQLAMILHDGGEAFGDRPRAAHLIEQAADAGHTLAQFNFAQMLVDRDPTPQGMERAVPYYEKAANAGLADAQYAMAEILRQGIGGKNVDLEQARHWLELAAAQNHDTAQIGLGAMLVEGVGGARDEEAGFAWLMRAAAAGNAAAQNRVAKLYRAGIGVEPDRVAASAWYLRARKTGLVDAIMEDQLDGLTEEELEEARKQADSLG